MVLDDYESDYETLLQKVKMQNLHLGRIKTLATEIYRPCTQWIKAISARSSKKIVPEDVSYAANII